MFGFSEDQIVGIIVIIAIFLVIRELFCWYWKINQSVALLTEIRDLLQAEVIIPQNIEPQKSPAAKSKGGDGPQPKTPCDNCGSLVPVKRLKTYNAKQLCPSCLNEAKK